MTAPDSYSSEKKIWTAVCAAHLAVVGLLVADFALSWLKKGSEGLQGVEWAAMAAVAWLLLAALALPFVRRRPRLLRFAARFSLAAISIFLALAVAEVGLRLFVPQRDPWQSYWEPGSLFHLDAAKRSAPGVTGIGTFTINEIGLRGPSIHVLDSQKNPYTIITVGGSTTECAILDDSEQWPQLLMDDLNQRQQRRFVYVGNTGVSGHDTLQHLEFIRRLRVLDRADLVLLQIGVNDLRVALELNGRLPEEAYPESASRMDRLLRELHGPPARYPYFRRLRTYGLAYRWARRDAYPSLAVEEAGGVDLDRVRKARARAPVAPMPNLSKSIAGFRIRVSEIARSCRDRGFDCMFLTQPTIWRDDLDPEAEKLLWFGWIGEDDPIEGEQSSNVGYVSVANLAAAMGSFNQALLDTCRDEGLECFDLAAEIPKTAEAFFDDCHFTEHGSSLVGQAVTDWLLRTRAFQDALSGSHSP